MSLDLAVKHALKNPIKRKGRSSISRMAAVLTVDNCTYVGYNSYKSHPLQARFGENEHKIYIHAEIAAIVKACREYDGYYHIADFKDMDAKLYVARVLHDGTPALAKPCPGCLAAIAEFGINHVEYTK